MRKIKDEANNAQLLKMRMDDNVEPSKDEKEVTHKNEDIVAIRKDLNSIDFMCTKVSKLSASGRLEGVPK